MTRKSDCPAYLEVEVSEGLFVSERNCRFAVGDRYYNLICDESSVDGTKMDIYVLEDTGTQATVRLPRETFSSGDTIHVPSSLVKWK